MEIYQTFLTHTDRKRYSSATDETVNGLLRAINRIQPNTFYVSEEKVTFNEGKWWGGYKRVTEWFYGVYISKYPISETAAVTVVSMPTGDREETTTVFTRSNLIAYLNAVLDTLNYVDDVIERKAKEHNFKLH